MKKIGLFAILTGVLVLNACQPTNARPEPTQIPSPTAEAISNTSDVEPIPGGTLVFSFGAGNPRHFNPALLSGSATVIPGAQIFASPLRYDDKWNPQPYLAESWNVAEDGLSITLHLVENATFHDGKPITSSDVAFSVLTVQEYHPFKPMFAPVTGVDTPDPHTAVIRLSRPHPAILMSMSPAFLPILPEHIYGDGQNLATHTANLEPVGSGPFKFVSFEPGKRLVLERFDNYFIPGRPYLDRIELWIDLDPASQVVTMTRQDAHMTSPFLNLDGLEQLTQYEYLTATQKGFEGIGAINWLAFNHLREPLNDFRVRQAIAYGIDLDFIIQYLHEGLSKRTISPIIMESPFFEPDLPSYAYDPDIAAELLDQAGYPLQENGSRFSLTLDYLPVLPTQQHDIAYYISSQLKEIGVDVQVRDSASFPEWAQRIGEWDFDMTMDAVFNWGDPVIGVHRTYISENIRQGVVWSNTQNYRNSQVDDILAQAAEELDFEKRKAHYSQFQKIVAEELPVLWINSLPNHTVYHTGLGNPPLTIWGVHSPLDEVFWRDIPQKAYITPPIIGEEAFGESLSSTGIRAIQLLQKNDIYTAREILTDPEEGFLDLDDTGLHIIGFNREGIVFLDNSGQFTAGMDISGISNKDGTEFVDLFIEAAQSGKDSYLQIEELWPHPETQEVGTMFSWCGLLTSDEIICTLTWGSGDVQ